MTSPQLEISWSGVLERQGQAPGLSSPLIGSAARLCMHYGYNAIADKPLAVTVKTQRRHVCVGCGLKFHRTNRERMCAPCFVESKRAGGMR